GGVRLGPVRGTAGGERRRDGQRSEQTASDATVSTHGNLLLGWRRRRPWPGPWQAGVLVGVTIAPCRSPPPACGAGADAGAGGRGDTIASIDGLRGSHAKSVYLSRRFTLLCG